MRFFVTSTGNGAAGADYGGVAGADARCQCLAAAVGMGHRTWRAYLSTAPLWDGSGTLVHARNRIGAGPWHNYWGQLIASNVNALHSSPPDYTRIIDERGRQIPFMEHDILTGSDANGYALTRLPGNPASDPPTCANWTDGSDNTYAWVGHSNWNWPGGNITSWNASHETQCSEYDLRAHWGTARLYCFAID